MRRHVLISTIVVGLLAGACGDESPTIPTVPTSSVATSTTVATTTTTLPAEAEQAVWPFVDGDRYATPEDAVRTFALEYLDYTDPALSAFAAGDNRSGEIEVRAGPGLAAFTTVLVRQFADDTWWILGASTPDIVSISPAPGATVGSPVTLEGESRAFEANVNVDIRVARSTASIASGFVMGGGFDGLAPYSKAFDFVAGDADRGVIVLRVLSPKDGGAESATIIPVQFG